MWNIKGTDKNISQDPMKLHARIGELEGALHWVVRMLEEGEPTTIEGNRLYATEFSLQSLNRLKFIVEKGDT